MIFLLLTVYQNLSLLIPPPQKKCIKLKVYNQLLIFQDVAALQGKITNLKGSYEVKAWNHLDFIWGVDAATLVYKPIIELIIKDLKTNG